jgi:hypothetical protein
MLAKGEATASSADRKSRDPASMTVRPGRNFRTWGFGVVSVWMNMGLIWPVAARDARSQRARAASCGAH